MMDYLANAIFLAIVSLACWAHVNHMQRAPFYERAGFVLLASAAGADSAWYIGALFHWRGIHEAERLIDTSLYMGLAFVAMAMLRGQLTRLLQRARGVWDGIDRRNHPITAGELDERRFQRRR